MRGIQAIEMVSALAGMMATMFGVAIAEVDGGAMVIKGFIFLAFALTMIWFTEGDNDD